MGLSQIMAMQKDEQGNPRYTVASILALGVFFLVALQCLSTVAIIAKESGSWKFAITQFFVFNGAAYLLAVMVFQILK